MVFKGNISQGVCRNPRLRSHYSLYTSPSATFQAFLREIVATVYIVNLQYLISCSPIDAARARLRLTSLHLIGSVQGVLFRIKSFPSHCRGGEEKV